MMIKKYLPITLAIVVLLFICGFSQHVYATESTKKSVEVSEVVTGDNPDTTEDFQVQMVGDSDTNPMPDGTIGNIATINIKGGSSGTFGEISYTTAGVYSYTISQTKGTTEGYTYDARTYNLTVYVNTDGEVSTIIKDNESGEKVTQIKFYNNYLKKTEPDNGGNLHISMVFEGDISSAETVEITVEFSGTGDKSFTYTDVNGNVLGVIKSGDKIDMKNGDEIIIKGIPDGTNYKVTMTAKPYCISNPITGVYTGIIRSGHTETAPYVVTYKPPTPAPVSIDPPVQKQVTGVGAPSDSLFTFKIESTDSKFPMPNESGNGIKTVNIKGPGSVELGWITFTEKGVYTYKISEIDTGLEGYTYDSNIYTMRVTVTEEEGILKASRAIIKEDKTQVKQMIFVNKYSSETSVTNTTKNPSETGGVETGDTYNKTIYIVLMGVAIAAVVVVVFMFFVKKRKNKDEDKTDEGR